MYETTIPGRQHRARRFRPASLRSEKSAVALGKLDRHDDAPPSLNSKLIASTPQST